MEDIHGASILGEIPEHGHEASLLGTLLGHFRFLLASLLIIFVIAVVTSLSERWAEKKTGIRVSGWPSKKLAMTGILSAVAGVLMMIEIPVSFLVPDIYKLEISDVAALLAGFLMGPVAAVFVEFLKTVIHVIFHGTHSAFVGELASFLLGSAFVVPASLLFMGKRTKGRMLAGMVLGAVSLIVFGAFFNGFYLIPKFAELYGVDVAMIVKTGTAISSSIDSLWSFVALAVVPFILLKAVIASVIAGLICRPLVALYKRI